MATQQDLEERAREVMADVVVPGAASNAVSIYH